MREEDANSERLLADLAATQHGVATTAQLTQRGFDKDRILRGVRAGRLHRVHRAVYAVGHTGLSFEARCMAAVLALGEMAALSHESAAALWGMLKPKAGPIHVSLPHRHLPQPVFRRAVRRALDLRLITSSDIRDDPALTRSELERHFLSLCRRHRLPSPDVNARVGSHEVDFLWRDRGLVVEVDGFRHHGHRAAFEGDRAKDAALQGLGFRVLRFTYRQVEPRGPVVEALRALLGQRSLAPNL